MENSEAIQIFNNAIKNATNADQIAKIELVREFCTNEQLSIMNRFNLESSNV